MPHASLRDVAARAGVSFQTASKVLNGKGSVSAATRGRILEAAESLGYVPNAVAQSLISGSTRTIGVVATDFSDTVLSRALVGIEHEARRRGWSVLIGSLDEDGTDLEQYVRILVGRRVDGIIFNTPATEWAPDLRRVLPDSMPAVSLHQVAGGGMTYVGIDNAAAGLLAVRHLLSLGHRSIGLITGATSRWATRERTRAYREALEEAGIRFDEELVEASDWRVEGGYAATHRLLDRRAKLSAIYVQNDTMAVGVLAALHDRGRRVPADCAVVSCDDLPIAQRTIPPLTTTRIPFYEAGELAMRLLLERIARPQTEPGHVLLPVQMMYRASTGSRAPVQEETLKVEAS